MENYDYVSLSCTVILFSMGKCILDVPLKGEMALVPYFFSELLGIAWLVERMIDRWSPF